MKATSKFQWMARAGYSARAAVFFLVGGLALFSGLSGGGSDTKSALDALLQQPFGRVWVGGIALGLVGFVVWRIAQSLGNADHHNDDAKGIAIRIALFGSALAYTGLAYYALDHALGLGSQSNGNSEKGLAAWAMLQPFGRYLAGLIGIGFIIGGIVTMAKGVLRRYERYLAPEAKGSAPIKFACIYGLGARGMLFAIVGGFFVYAAFHVTPEKAGTISDALNWMRSLPFGSILYTVAAVGLASFGAYNVIQARYRIVQEPEAGSGVKKVLRQSAQIVQAR